MRERESVGESVRGERECRRERVWERGRESVGERERESVERQRECGSGREKESVEESMCGGERE